MPEILEEVDPSVAKKRAGSRKPEVAPSHFESGPPDEQHYRPRKVQITLRVDSDVIQWFRQNHPRYQTLMNAVLRKEMMQALTEDWREKVDDRAAL